MKRNGSNREVDYRALVENVEIAWIPMKDGRQARGALAAAQGPRRNGRFPPSSNTSPIAAATERARAMTRRITGSPPMAMAWRASISPARAIPTGLVAGRVSQARAGRRAGNHRLARQAAWCTGNVGMIGISWGGFNGLQVAARRPPALKAVISLCSTVDRYADDVHFMGGCVLERHARLGRLFLHHRRPAARSRDRRQGSLARAVEAPHRQHGLLPDAVDGASAPRRLLEARLGLRELRRDRMSRS